MAKKPWTFRVEQYEFNKEFRRRFYPESNIGTMPYRIPKRFKHGRTGDWEKMHTQAVKLRRRARFGGY